jgi:hypothetical protein
MSEQSIFDGVEYIYAEMLKGKRVKLTIKSVTGGAKFFCPQSNKNDIGFDVVFNETDKKLGVTSVTVRRQLYVATGTENPEKMAGKQIILYPVESKRSASGQAIRVAKVD